MSSRSAEFESFQDEPSQPHSTSSFGEKLWNAIKTILAPFASLKLTVALFFCSIWLIFVGTLAQYEMNMWEVIDHYFRSVFAWMDFKVLFPKSFFPSDPDIPGGAYIPGGLLLGIALAVNLTAAHLVRFKTQAKGRRLYTGLGVMLFGVFITALIVLGGHNSDGLQGSPMISWNALWNLIRIGIGAAGLGFVVLLITVDRSRKVELYGLTFATIVFGVLSIYLLTMGTDSRLSDPSLRILWQLIQGLFAGLVLLIGSVMIFKRRGGIVVIHAGVGLLMFGEALVGLYAVEEQIALAEGQTLSFARDTRSIELAVVDHSPAEQDDVIVIPNDLVTKEGNSIDHELLPFDVEIVKYVKNSTVRPPESNEENLATAGSGLGFVADPARASSGAGSGTGIDIPAIYAKVTPKGDPSAAETYLFALQFGDSEILTASGMPPIAEKIRVGEKFYDVSLRYKRNYKPYQITLKDVQKKDYLGTSTPRDYSSYVSLVDTERDFSRDDIRIWMNNPLRYAGETFYQSGYNQRSDGTEVTTLQLVTNTGWMIPYVSCMLTLVGLLYHFSLVLYRFLNRKLAEADPMLTTAVAGAVATTADEKATVQREQTGGAGSKRRKRKGATKRAVTGNSVDKPRGDLAPHQTHFLDTIGSLLPIILAAFCLLYAGSKLRPKEMSHHGMRMDRFADIPIVYGGRVKPIDTLARNTLRTVSDKQVLRVPEENGDWSKTEKEFAVVWLLDAMTQSDACREHRVFRIDNPDVLEVLSLERRKGFRYSIDDLSDGIEQFEKEAEAAQKIAAEDASRLTYHQRKLLETSKRLRAFTKVQASFLPIPFPAMPSEEERKNNPETATATMKEIAQRLAATPRLNQALIAMQPPLIVPMSHGEEAWLPFAAAANNAFLQRIMTGEGADPRVRSWSTIIDAYIDQDAQEFNRAVSGYLKDVRTNPPTGYDPFKVGFERRFNDFQPFVVGMVLYVFAFLLTTLSWIGWFQPLRKSALTVLVITFLIHTLAIVARIYISGRPPVTNLYSSAVFIGWAGAAFGIVLELVFRIGFGNILSSVIGFTTLFIAHQLAYGGDTFTVLQAVLDTQIWLATHVVCITLGYAATFVAGGLAILYIFVGLFSKRFNKEMMRTIGKMVYGILCFAIFFSFIGTVLGGLWADDSWGRFWGWDPKENGALMIVLWNALILHARWGKMVGDRGVAVLAVVGNIVTAWSWFGVNELGIGLHSYGFTDGVLSALGIFALLMLGIVALGLLPKAMWLSQQAE